jgi:hypothetical protein
MCRFPSACFFCKHENMKKSISVNKKSRGRPEKAGGVDLVSAVRLPADVIEQVDA